MKTTRNTPALLLLVFTLLGPLLPQTYTAGSAQGIEIAPTPLPTPTPGPVGNTYQSPHGWSISWSDEWSATTTNERVSFPDGWREDTLYLTQEAYPDLTVEVRSRGGKQFFCQGAVFGIPAAISVDGSYLKHQGGEYHNWVVYMEDIHADTADEPDVTVATYYECRRIAEPLPANGVATYVEFEASAPIDTYQAVADSIQSLAGNMRPSPENLIPAPTPTPTPPPTPTPVPDETYTDPVYGWSIAWNPMEYGTFVRGGDANGSYVALTSYTEDVTVSVSDFFLAGDAQVTRDVDGCLDQLLGLQDESAIVDKSDEVDVSQLPSHDYDYAFKLSEDDQGWSIFNMCIDLGGGDHFFLVSGSTSLSGGGTTSGMMQVVYTVVASLTLP